MHPTIEKMQSVVASGDHTAIAPLLAPDVTFLPPTYWKTWTGRDAVAAVLGHVGQVFTDFRYRRIMGEGADWALEFQCKVGEFDAVGVDRLPPSRQATYNYERNSKIYIKRIEGGRDLDASELWWNR